MANLWSDHWKTLLFQLWTHIQNYSNIFKALSECPNVKNLNKNIYLRPKIFKYLNIRAHPWPSSCYLEPSWPAQLWARVLPSVVGQTQLAKWAWSKRSSDSSDIACRHIRSSEGSGHLPGPTSFQGRTGRTGRPGRTGARSGRCLGRQKVLFLQ